MPSQNQADSSNNKPQINPPSVSTSGKPSVPTSGVLLLHIPLRSQCRCTPLRPQVDCSVKPFCNLDVHRAIQNDSGTDGGCAAVTRVGWGLRA
eukprot:jgi/Psemu1/39026/gm1.39026_g